MILWSEEYIIGIEEIDEQHRRFVELAKPVFEAQEALQKESIKETLYNLSEYMKLHFSDEEIYMKKIGFNELKAHKELHEALVNELVVVIQTPAKLPIIQAKIRVIVKKFIKHIRDEDHKIKLFIENMRLLGIETQEEIFEL